jgi:asparagine synthase (glutamine-hydrolysing)
MTLIAGIFSRYPRSEISEADCSAIRRTISRHPGDTVTEFLDRRLFVAKVDVQSYSQRAWMTTTDGSIATLVGEPLLPPDDTGVQGGRDADLNRLHRASDGERRRLLATSRGVFAAVLYDAVSGSLTIANDRLGVRPMYIWIGGAFVVFASQLRVLEQLQLVPKIMSLRGVTELIAMGMPLGDRTPYSGIILMKAAEIFEAKADGVRRSTNCRWDEIPASTHDLDRLGREAYDLFCDAVRVRLGSDRTTAAFLSGGLDSRAVVAALRAECAKLYTFNFAPSGTQDQIFGAEFARVAGTVHTERPMNLGDPSWSALMADAWGAICRSSAPNGSAVAERPGLVWSGDGGSVGLGHVYVSRAITDILRAGKVDEGITAFLKQQGASVPHRFFNPDIAPVLADVAHLGLREELTDLRTVDAGSTLHIFLLLNDQRRHLELHFETIDQHRLEFQLPFFDGEFLAAVLSVPLNERLGHKFYMRWLRNFASETTAVPWQAYPGHEPCPVPVSERLAYQWHSGQREAERDARKPALIKKAGALVRAPDFPHGILRLAPLRLALLAYRLGLRDYGYLIDSAQVLHKYWQRAGGRYENDVAAGGSGNSITSVRTR